MPKMTAMEAAVHVMKSEGVDLVFGVPGAAILPLYQALRPSGIRHVLVRHEEGGDARGGRLQPRRCGQDRRQYRHLGTCRYEYDYGLVFGNRRQRAHPVHYGSSAARQTA